MAYTLIHADNYEHLKSMEDNSVDAIITDSPYGLGKEPDVLKMLAAWIEHGYLEVKGAGFMNKKWDAFVPQPLFWKECFRVLKPGGYCLSFFGTRTYDWGVMAMRIAGFEIRDCIQWLYGEGFPKSMDISKAIDKMHGAEREVIGTMRTNVGIQGGNFSAKSQNGMVNITAPATDEAKQWNGYGTALKPANEPIVVARKPISEKSIALNVLRWGTGAINIDAGRIGTDVVGWTGNPSQGYMGGLDSTEEGGRPAVGRFPANVVLDPEAAEILDQQTGRLVSGMPGVHRKCVNESSAYGKESRKPGQKMTGFGDAGGASRFFYVAKPSPDERGEYNDHPTVKPVKLMRWLVRIFCPAGGTVLDPHSGSGSTIIACEAEGFNSIGIDNDEHSISIAERRVQEYQDEVEFGKDYNPSQTRLDFGE